MVTFRFKLLYILFLLQFISCKKDSDSNVLGNNNECTEIENIYFYVTDFYDCVHINAGDTIKYSNSNDTIKFVVKDTISDFYFYENGYHSGNYNCTHDFCEYKAMYIESLDKIWKISFMLGNFNIYESLSIRIYKKINGSYVQFSNAGIHLPIKKENDNRYMESITINNKIFYNVIYTENQFYYNKQEGLFAIKNGSVTYLKN